jgi:PAT family beta-lactamase induction signal transducer AmpG
MADALQSWPLAFSYSALLLLPGVLGSFLAPEPALPEEAPRTFAQGFLVPFRDLIQRLGSRVLFVFAFVLLFKMGDSVLNALAVIFLKNSGYTDIVIGSVRSVAGLIATLAGVAIGGLVFLRLKTLPSLWIFGILQAVSNLAYVWLAGIPHPGFSPLVVIVVIENFCGGLATAAFTAFLMGVCNPAASAVQYALLTAVMSIGQVGIAASLSGYLISLPAMTWNLYFWISTLLGLPGLLLLPFLGKAVRNDRNPA